MTREAVETALESDLTAYCIDSNGCTWEVDPEEAVDKVAMESCFLMSQIMPDAVDPVELSEMVQSGNAMVAYLEDAGSDEVVAVAISSLRTKEGERYLAVNVDVWGEPGGYTAFLDVVEIGALKHGCKSVRIVANGPLPYRHGSEYQAMQHGCRVYSLTFNWN